MRFMLPDHHPLTDQYAVVRCIDCGFVYADTASTQAEYDQYYADLSKYADSTTGTGGGEQSWDRERLHATAAEIATSLPDPAARVVDIGCANGGLLSEFAEAGYTRLEGVDPSPACAAAVNALPGVTGHVGTIFDLPEAVRGADCLILSHVLEHVRDVGRALGHLRQAVSDGGSVYVEVPDASRYTQCLVAPFQDFNVEHINHFSAVSLANALRCAGFQVERVQEKTIRASETANYPAVSAFARASRPGSPAPVVDEVLGPAMRAYIAASESLLDEIAGHLDAQLNGVADIVVWGAGQTTLTVLANTRVGGARVLAIADSNPRYHNRRLGGIPIVAPSDLVSIDAPIVIGSLISHAAIVRQIHQLGLPNRIVALRSNVTRSGSQTPQH
jgi:SAM-dependent methyltransferase